MESWREPSGQTNLRCGPRAGDGVFTGFCARAAAPTAAANENPTTSTATRQSSGGGRASAPGTRPSRKPVQRLAQADLADEPVAGVEKQNPVAVRGREAGVERDGHVVLRARVEHGGETVTIRLQQRFRAVGRTAIDHDDLRLHEALRRDAR